MRPSGNRPPRILAINRVVTGPNPLGEMDWKYGSMAGEVFISAVSSMSLIDPFWRIISDLTGPAVQAFGILEGAVQARQADWGYHVPVIRTDNGPPLVAQRWATGCQDLGITLERVPVVTPNKNAPSESWHSLLEGDCGRNPVFQTVAEAYTVTAEWIRFDHERRMHGSLHDGAPAVSDAQCQTGTVPTIHPVRCGVKKPARDGLVASLLTAFCLGAEGVRSAAEQRPRGLETSGPPGGILDAASEAEECALNRLAFSP
ncbi:DDE-type integrase/transposase/recombinase [Sulfobacillus thermosulfidooxidans]|uniref:DDE-type integrase/transposase/recombinase n=1 Tax=Sulfobacillus thermosulfidooxidans TaxID=28034 RepID=UPI0002EBE983|nr:DDE-type integrase/transposase/recombinase [Sulfobacillus thermosulfidooxidans]